jgi:hypothetical protein
MALALLGTCVSGCKKRTIPNTDIEDNDFNREVIDFCERYRRAVEEKNVGLLLTLASPRYFDNSGTPTVEDDVDLARLEEVLKNRLAGLNTIRYEFRYRTIYELDNVIYVELIYNTAYQYDVGGELKWSNRTADNRLQLEAQGDGFLILSGM